MLPPSARMRRSDEFAATVRRGRRGSSRAVTVHVVPRLAGERTADLRVGFVVGRSVGPAVVRNRVRRRLRHLLRARLSALPAAAVVVRATPAAAAMSSDELARSVEQALERAGA